MAKNPEEKDTSNLNSGAKNKRTESPWNTTGKASARSPAATPPDQPAGQSSIPGGQGTMTRLCVTIYRRAFKNALLSEAVIGTIVKAVTDAILESVTSRVYESIDFDIKAKTEKIK